MMFRGTHNRLSSLAYLLVAALWGASTAVAQPPVLEERAGEAKERPTVMVVVESSLGEPFAQRVRELIAEHLDADVGPATNWSEQRGTKLPDAEAHFLVDVVVSVTVPVQVGADMHVVYWDRTGRTQAMAVPRPSGVGSLGWVAASLAVGMVRQHADMLQQQEEVALSAVPCVAGAPGASGGCGVSLVWAPYGMRHLLRHMGLVTHRTEGLTEKDF